MADFNEYWILKRPKIGTIVIYGEAKGAVLDIDGTISSLGPTLYYPQLTIDGEGIVTSSRVPTDAEVISGKLTLKGEPWTLHSIHFSQKEAIDQLRLVVEYVGEENARIVKIMPHEMVLKLK